MNTEKGVKIKSQEIPSKLGERKWEINNEPGAWRPNNGLRRIFIHCNDVAMYIKSVLKLTENVKSIQQGKNRFIK